MPLRSVEAATREDAIAAAREQFGASARVVGVRRVRSGGVLGFFATELWADSHIRLISVADTTTHEQQVPEVNFHLQGLQIRKIECEGLNASARFSFFPMRKGTYPFTVLNDTVEPSVEAAGTFVVE